MQSWFEVWKGVKTIQNFADIEINRKFTKLNFTNSRMWLLSIKFSFSFQCGIFILLIFLIAIPMEETNNQWREPMTEENIWNAAMSLIPNPGVTYFRFCHLTKCAAGGGCRILSWQHHWRQQRQSWKLAAKNYCKTSSGSLCLSPHWSIALFPNKKSPTIKPTTRRPG